MNLERRTLKYLARTCLFVAVCSLAFLVFKWFPSDTPTVGSLEYHEAGKREAWRTWAGDGSVYMGHLEGLMKLGAMVKLQYTFKNIRLGSTSADVIHRLLNDQVCPSHEFLTSPYSSEDAPLEVTVWCRPSEEAAWEAFFRDRDRISSQ